MSYFGFIYLGIFSLILAVLSFFNILYCYYFNLYLSLDNYITTLVISLFLGIILLLKKKDKIKITIYNKILIVLIGYVLTPIIISIPYYSSIYNITFLDSYFEAVSGFTSTGFSVFENIKHIDQSLILWRSTSQWIGGLYFLFSIILLIDIFDDNLKKSLTNFLSFNLSETFKQSFKIFLLYITLTFLIFLILKIFDLRSFDAFNLSMSLISSGGFLPVNNLSFLINTTTKEIIFSLLMLVSFFSIFVSYNLLFFKNKNINFFKEDIFLLIYFIFLIAIFFLFFDTKYDFTNILLSIISSISNIGVSLTNTPPNLSFIFLILSIIGGSFFSTSSGIRLFRLYALFKFSINNMISNFKPMNVSVYKSFFLDFSFEKKEINKYFLSVLIFILTIVFLSFLLTFSGISLEHSFKLSILTITNTVNSGMHGLNELNFQELHFFTKYYLIIFMIIGRVELLTLLIICKKFLFKN